MSKPRTIPSISNQKRRNGFEPIVMVTAYDAPSARVATEADVDMILVGDSLAMVVLGYPNTLEVTVDDIAYHTAAVARAEPQDVILGDMPWLSFHVDPADTVMNAAKLVRAGAHCVKIEGGAKRIPMIQAILAAEIPVMAHVGLTPQSTNVMGGFRVQAKESEAVKALIEEAIQLQEAGCFSMVVEGVPDVVGRLLTEALDIPTIGIGAGPDTDGQVLVYHDIIGLENRFKPKFVRRYGSAFEDQAAALRQYAGDVRAATFPGPDETYASGDDLSELLSLYGVEPGTGSA